MRRRFKGSKFFLFFLLAVAGAAVFSSVLELLWNALMPDIFHLPVITFWQAAGLLVLSKILFTGFHGGPFGGRWRHKLQQRWMEMTPEERERFKQEWGRRGGGFHRGFDEGRSRGGYNEGRGRGGFDEGRGGSAPASE